MWCKDVHIIEHYYNMKEAKAEAMLYIYDQI